MNEVELEAEVTAYALPWWVLLVVLALLATVGYVYWRGRE